MDHGRVGECASRQVYEHPGVLACSRQRGSARVLRSCSPCSPISHVPSWLSMTVTVPLRMAALTGISLFMAETCSLESAPLPSVDGACAWNERCALQNHAHRRRRLAALRHARRKLRTSPTLRTLRVRQRPCRSTGPAHEWPMTGSRTLHVTQLGARLQTTTQPCTLRDGRYWARTSDPQPVALGAYQSTMRHRGILGHDLGHAYRSRARCARLAIAAGCVLRRWAAARRRRSARTFPSGRHPPRLPRRSSAPVPA
jgi:hypothetical protein